jgi:hypothetical protein
MQLIALLIIDGHFWCWCNVIYYRVLLEFDFTLKTLRERTIPTERPPLVGNVSAYFLRIEGATWSA